MTMQHTVKITAPDKDPTQLEVFHTDIKIYVNNIAGKDKNVRKLEIITGHTKKNDIDIFLVQEMNITTKNTYFKRFIKHQAIREYHFVASKSQAKFLL
jgi:hypothetical protein